TNAGGGGTSNPTFNSLGALQGTLATTTLALVQNAATMNFATTGTGFPTPFNASSNFDAYYSGKINISAAGTYTFNTASDDGSVLWIDGTLVVNNNLYQGVGTPKTGSISLTSGYHNIVIGYYQGGGGEGLTAQ